jgi:TetR/AcrR family tetracycline transcriptional repressor
MGRPARPALTRERILQAAVALVDTDGLDTLSMRKLGAALGVEAMSPYHHVPNKAALLDGIYETVLAELPLPQEGEWASVLRERARAFRAVLAAHPRVIPLFAARPAVTSASLHHLEHGLSVLRRAGLSPLDALSAFQVTLAFVLGHALTSFASLAGDEGAGVNYDDLDAQRFPRVVEAARVLAQQDVSREFELGLDLLVQSIDRMRVP